MQTTRWAGRLLLPAPPAIEHQPDKRTGQFVAGAGLCMRGFGMPLIIKDNASMQIIRNCINGVFGASEAFIDSRRLAHRGR